MPNIRIKDIPTTASSTSSTDFIGIDGSANGTRKLNAYSPSFGGNATVGGTLGLNGAASGAVLNVKETAGVPTALNLTNRNSTQTWNFAVDGAAVDDKLLAFISSGSVKAAIGATSGNLLVGGTTDISGSGGLKVFGTTASTSTSTGALVVSGGVGVAGAVNVGGNATFAGVANHPDGSTAAPSIAFTADPDTGFARAATNILEAVAGGVRVATFRSTFLDIPLSTASTSTSTGALVVSGGVGVAKEMYLGGGLLNVSKSGAGSTVEINADSGYGSKIAMQRAATNRWTLEVDSSDVLTLKSLGTTAALTMTGTTSAEFVGSIKTAAPSGGTAANWKLGTVASVSPTSPNRTIEVDIGGTIYYIHAKTTNN